MKFIARVREIQKAGIHRIARIKDGEVVSQDPMAFPERVEIEASEDGGECMMYRYSRSGEFCGDTWHESLESALGQAEYEYGLKREDFLVLHDGSQGTQA
jgi:hypothetical protein